jgi:hypothetical protein
MPFENKLVAVLNKDIEPGRVMNALAHVSVGLGSEVGMAPLLLDTYVDAKENIYPNISKIPFIILRAKSNDIRKTVLQARENNIKHGVFLDTMTEGTYIEQLERTKNTDEEDLIYYGCTLFGPWDILSQMTKKFSLWK